MIRTLCLNIVNRLKVYHSNYYCVNSKMTNENFSYCIEFFNVKWNIRFIAKCRSDEDPRESVY